MAGRATPSRRSQLVEANIIAVQAYQMILARQQHKGSSACYPESVPDTDVLQSLVKHQASLLAEPAAQVVKWANSQSSTFDPAKDLKPLLDANLKLSPELPVNVFTRYLEKQAPGQPEESIRSVANLYQTVLELNRDGDLLQDLYRFYIALHLPVYVGQLGLPGSDADFLAAAQQLAGKSCASPVDLSVAAWQIAGRKVWNWGEKNLHIRGADAIATELLSEAQFAKLIPEMQAMPAEKIAIIGHSFTMDEHWASPSAFVPIVTRMFALENPGVQFWQRSVGGQSFSHAYSAFYPQALAWKPNVVLLVLMSFAPADEQALKAMVVGFRASGARVLMFDDVGAPDDSQSPNHAQRIAQIGKDAGAEIIPVSAIINAAPGHESFTAMDNIHRKEPYHRLMAKLWLQAILATKPGSSAAADGAAVGNSSSSATGQSRKP
ncbi:MAG: SGNH/GDSL hydrolase family protein [Acidobacteriaceae bacterium]